MRCKITSSIKLQIRYKNSCCGRARARPQTNLAFGGQRHVLKAYSARADLKENFGTLLAFLCSSNWNEWYVNKRRSKGPGVEMFFTWILANVVFRSTCHSYKHKLLVQAIKFSFHLKSVFFMTLHPRQNSRFAFDCSSLSSSLVLRHATFEFYNSTSLLLEMRHRSSDIQHSSFNIQHSSLSFNVQVLNWTSRMNGWPFEANPLRALGARSQAITRDIDRSTAAHVEWIQMLQKISASLCSRAAAYTCKWRSVM